LKLKDVTQVNSEQIQLCLPATNDLDFALYVAKLFCTCSAREADAPPVLCCELPWQCSPWCVCGGRA